MNNLEFQVYSQNQFYGQFDRDLMSAKARVVIYSPFLTVQRVDAMRFRLRELVACGITVCVVVQEQPSRSNFFDEGETKRREAWEKAVSELLSIGVHVTFRSKIHEKLAVIDERIFWEGSLNILSYWNSYERMTRWVGREKVLIEIERHRLMECDRCMEAGVLIDDFTKVRNALIERRKSLGLSQKMLAEKAKIAQSTISDLESSRQVDFRLRTYVRLCAVLKLKIRFVPECVLPSLDEQLGSVTANKLSNDQIDSKLAKKNTKKNS